MRAHAIIPVREQMKKSSYSFDCSRRIFDGKVIVKSPCPLLEGAIPPLDVVSDSECLLDVI